MSFNVNDPLTINGVLYRIAEHPAAPGFPYSLHWCRPSLAPSSAAA